MLAKRRRQRLSKKGGETRYFDGRKTRKKDETMKNFAKREKHLSISQLMEKY